MVGVWLLFTIGLIMIHWAYVMPFYLDDWIEEAGSWSPKQDRWVLSKIVGTGLCCVWPLYIFIAVLIYLNMKAKAHKERKEKLRDEVIG